MPKSFLPNYREYYEKRWFAPAAASPGQTIRFGRAGGPLRHRPAVRGEDLPGLDLPRRDLRGLLGAGPALAAAALAGATILANLSASNITIGKADERRLLCHSQSARCLAAYVYSAAGPGESHHRPRLGRPGVIYELGDLLAETERFPRGAPVCTSPTSTSTAPRRSACGMRTFNDNRRAGRPRRRVPPRPLRATRPTSDIGLIRPIERFPFVPTDRARLDQDCYEAFNIQVAGPAQRLRGDAASSTW